MSKSKKLHLYVWRSGLVEVGETTPHGAIFIAEGNGKKLRDCFVLCRLMKDGSGRYLCNGIPEAKTDDQALMAAKRFQHCVDNKLAGRKAFEGLQDLMAKQGFDGFSYYEKAA